MQLIIDTLVAEMPEQEKNRRELASESVFRDVNFNDARGIWLPCCCGGDGALRMFHSSLKKHFVYACACMDK